MVLNSCLLQEMEVCPQSCVNFQVLYTWLFSRTTQKPIYRRQLHHFWWILVVINLRTLCASSQYLYWRGVFLRHMVSTCHLILHFSDVSSC